MNNESVPACNLGHIFCLTNNLTNEGPENRSVSEDSSTSSGVLSKLSYCEYEWSDYKKQLTWALSIHIYGFACFFFMLAFYTFFSILNLRSQLSTRPFMSTINVFVCLLGISRAICFLFDPYYSIQAMPKFLGWVIWDLGYPCIVSAFSLIQLAFSQLTQMKFRPESLRKKSLLTLIICIHFLFVIGSNIIGAFHHQMELIRAIVKETFLCWGLLLCVTFLYGGAKILNLLKTLPNSAFQGNEPVTEHKGILQLALLAQCNNIASSVLTAAAPSLLAPRIKITDEDEQTCSTGSKPSELPTIVQNDADSAHTALAKLPEVNVASVESPLEGSIKQMPITKTPSPTSVGTPIVKIEISASTPESQSVCKTQQEFHGHASSYLLGDEIDAGSPKRKKSLTWSDNAEGEKDYSSIPRDVPHPSTSRNLSGATLGQEISTRRQKGGNESSGSRRSSSTVSTCSNRKGSVPWDPGTRKGSYCSVSSLRHGSIGSNCSNRRSSYVKDNSSRKGSHVGEALVLSKRNSLCAEASGRRGSNMAAGPASSRRGSRKSFAAEEPEAENLIRRPSEGGDDVTLSSILNHIAYVNQANSETKPPPKAKESRKEQVRQVLIVTYVTALLGMVLSLLLVFGLYIRPPPKAPLNPWIWFTYESFCRLLEFLIGCAMANITRQPVNRYTQYGHTLRMKPRNSIYM